VHDSASQVPLSLQLLHEPVNVARRRGLILLQERRVLGLELGRFLRDDLVALLLPLKEPRALLSPQAGRNMQ